MTPVVKPEQQGTTTGYRYGCRCDDCRAAQTARCREQRGYQPGEPRGSLLERQEAARVEDERRLGPPAICRFGDCERPAEDEGYCQGHRRSAD